jgi:glutathione S-transferase
MPVQYVDFEDAREKSGLRMVVVSGIPSPWGEAAKGFLHIKGIEWVAVRLDQRNDEMAAWTGERAGPVAMYNDEPPRSSWAQILLLAERLAPQPALLPESADERALVFGLAHEICGEMGLGWTRRLCGVHSGLEGGPGFPEGVAKYLGAKYGYRAEEASGYSARVAAVLNMLSGRLHAQAEAGSPYYVGQNLTAVDVYSATFMALFNPLPQELCPLSDSMRPALEALDEVTAEALDPILIQHRDRMYDQHLELPLSL